MTRFICFIISFLIFLTVHCQPMSGTTGLLNTPSAEMQSDGTFFMGANYLPDEFTPEVFNYNTGNYYVNITFLPFLEINYRLTILKLNNDRINQDRSFGIRARLLKEKKSIPSLVVGGNDLYSSGGIESSYFNSIYGVTTKHFKVNQTQIALTAGFAYKASGEVQKENLKGLFGGVSVSPGFLPSFKVIAEYDSIGFNTGLTVLILKHLFVYGFMRDFKIPAGGLAYYIYL